MTYFGTLFVKLISEVLKYPNPPNERLPIRIARQRSKLGVVLTPSDVQSVLSASLTASDYVNRNRQYYIITVGSMSSVK